MPTRFRVKYGLNALITLINLGFPLAVMWYAARVLGADALGKYQFANALAAQFVLLAGFGWNLYGSRLLAAMPDPEERIVLAGEILRLNFITTAIALTVYTALILTVPNLQDHLPVFAIMSIILLGQFFASDFVFVATEKYGSLLWRGLFVKVLAFGCLLLWVSGPGDLLTFCGIIAGSTLIQQVLTFISLDFKKLLGTSTASKSRHFYQALWIFLAIQVSNLYVNLDTFFVGLIHSPEIVAYYAVAIRTLRLGVAAIAYLGTAFMVRNAKDIANENSGTANNSFLSARISLGLMVPIAAICMVKPDFVITLLFGAGYQPAESVLQIASPIVLLAGINHAFGTQLLIPLGREKAIFYCGLIAAIVGLGLLWPLTLQWQHQGAAWAALAAETTALLSVLFVTRGLRVPLMRLLPIFMQCSLAIAVGMAIWSYGPFQGGLWQQCAGAFAALTSYCTILFLTGAIPSGLYKSR